MQLRIETEVMEWVMSSEKKYFYVYSFFIPLELNSD